MFYSLFKFQIALLFFMIYDLLILKKLFKGEKRKEKKKEESVELRQI